MNTLRVALAQMMVEPGDVPGNMSRAEGAIAQAGERGAAVVVLPETCDVGWTYPGARAGAQPLDGSTVQTLQRAAARHEVAVVAGVTERAGEQLYNTSVAIDATGHVLGHHRKINELDFARAVYATGDTVTVTSTPLGVWGIAVCADLSAATLTIGRTMGVLGAQLMLSPCAWAVPPHHDNKRDPYVEWIAPYTALARECAMPVIGVSNVGPVRGGEWDGWRCIGASLAVSATGEVLAQLPYGQEHLEVIDLELPYLT